MALKLIAAPAAEPVSLVEVKAHLRIDGDDENTLLNSLITAARQEAEKITRRALITQTWELVRDGFGCEPITIPLPPLQSVTSVKYIDQAGVEQTINPSVYQVDTDSEPGRITPAFGQVWPSARGQMSAVRIRYVAGYGAASAVPAAIKQWLLIRIAALYENREDDPATKFVDGLLDEYRAVTF